MRNQTNITPKKSKKVKRNSFKKNISASSVNIKQEIETKEIIKPVVEKPKLVSPLKRSRDASNVSITSPQSEKASTPSSKPKKKKHRNKDSDTSSGEERWLDAIESGKLEDIDDELKKIKDPKLMTARQRAMYERNTDKDSNTKNSGEVLMSLPTGYKEKVMTAEAIQKAQLKSLKRKQLADEKREKDKQKTVERLLKKQDSNKSNKQNKSKQTKPIEILMSYRQRNDGTSRIIIPLNDEFPLKQQMPKKAPKIILCGVNGCNNKKVYNCSKTNVPLCSLVCYNKNLKLNEKKNTVNN